VRDTEDIRNMFKMLQQVYGLCRHAGLIAGCCAIAERATPWSGKSRMPCAEFK
jgi:hypothetical protein